MSLVLNFLNLLFNMLMSCFMVIYESSEVLIRDTCLQRAVNPTSVIVCVIGEHSYLLLHRPLQGVLLQTGCLQINLFAIADPKIQVLGWSSVLMQVHSLSLPIDPSWVSITLTLLHLDFHAKFPLLKPCSHIVGTHFYNPVCLRNTRWPTILGAQIPLCCQALVQLVILFALRWWDNPQKSLPLPMKLEMLLRKHLIKVQLHLGEGQDNPGLNCSWHGSRNPSFFAFS